MVWGSSVLRSLVPAATELAPAEPQVSALTHLATPHDEQFMVDGDVVVLKLQQRHQLQAGEQRWGAGVRLGNTVSQPVLLSQIPNCKFPALSRAGEGAQGDCAAW